MRISIRRRSKQSGFTLVEALVASAVLMIGILGLAAMLADSLAYMNIAQYDYIAQQKAAEAVESIFTARNMGQATWNTICNTGSPICSNGIFLQGAQQLCDPGLDGILGTADDNCGNLPDAILVPGNSGTLNPPARIPLKDFNFTRTIAITNAVDGGGNTIPNLRQIQVIVSYRLSNRPGVALRNYTLTTYISNFS